MKFQALTLFAIFAICSTLTLNAQNRGSSELSKTKMLKQQELKRMPTPPNGASRRGAAAYNASDLDLSDSQGKKTIKAYKLDYNFNPYRSFDNPVTSMTLYGDANKKIGMIHFYADGAEALEDRKALDDKKIATLSYHIDMLEQMEKFISTSRKVVLVTDSKTKEAYLTTDLLPTRAR
ncbi:MAG: hypothetical protein ACPG5B_02090 [Chitinophagales bacterium]